MLDIQIYEIVSTKTKKRVNRTRVAAPGISLKYQSLGLRPLCSTAFAAFWRRFRLTVHQSASPSTNPPHLIRRIGGEVRRIGIQLPNPPRLRRQSASRPTNPPLGPPIRLAVHQSASRIDHNFSRPSTIGRRFRILFVDGRPKVLQNGISVVDGRRKMMGSVDRRRRKWGVLETGPGTFYPFRA